MPDLPQNPQQYAHIFVEGRRTVGDYTSPKSGSRAFRFPDRNVQQHAALLRQSLESIGAELEQVAAQHIAGGITENLGIVLEVESDPGFPLKVDSLEKRKSGIELLNVRVETIMAQGAEQEVTKATVFVPYGKLDRLTKLVEDYRTQQTAKQHPKNQPLVASIANIRRAALGAFWTENEPLPGAASSVWWEAWLRAGTHPGERDGIERQFLAHVASLGLQIFPKSLRLAENTIHLVQATQAQLAESLDLLNCLTELRNPQQAADFFMGLNPQGQADWVSDLVNRITPPPHDSPAVCLLDSGVNRQHPLLVLALAANDAHTYNPTWGTADETVRPHGTEMAGLALYGELTPTLAASGTVQLRHRLESVKIYRESDAHAPQLYGSVTRDGVSAPEIAASGRKRVFSLQVTSRNTANKGKPTSWSTTIDELCASMNEEVPDRRLIFISAGNVGLTQHADYPNRNNQSSLHDPAQAWNAISVGAHTEKDTIHETALAGRQIVAPRGGLGPQSSTSLVWDDQWPIKPDFVMEGGNMFVEPSSGSVDFADSLQLLTTNANFQSRLLATTGDTSAATVQAARYAAIMMSEYPALWPETLRALLVHSCEWTPEMLGHQDKWLVRQTGGWSNVLRRFGYGTPNIARALRTLRNSVTLICQGDLQPFILDGSHVKTKEWAVHKLPWPRSVLAGQLNLQTELRVTLSYFVEPNPGPPASNNKYRYASCGLRFDVRRPTEDENGFQARINKQMRDEDGSNFVSGSDSNEWLLGSQLRARGSLHTDVWHGTAAQLAEKNHIAVYPVNGWWRLRKHLGKANNKVRYALVVTISTPPNTVDIYTPIVNEIATTIDTTAD